MGRETELKLALATNGWRRFLRHPLLATALAAPHVQTLRNIYFDTPDFELRRRRARFACAAPAGAGCRR
jgi:inorganic triphosphatase YgiF